MFSHNFICWEPQPFSAHLRSHRKWNFIRRVTRSLAAAKTSRAPLSWEESGQTRVRRPPSTMMAISSYACVSMVSDLFLLYKQYISTCRMSTTVHCLRIPSSDSESESASKRMRRSRRSSDGSRRWLARKARAATTNASGKTEPKRWWSKNQHLRLTLWHPTNIQQTSNKNSTNCMMCKVVSFLLFEWLAPRKPANSK